MSRYPCKSVEIGGIPMRNRMAFVTQLEGNEPRPRGQVVYCVLEKAISFRKAIRNVNT